MVSSKNAPNNNGLNCLPRHTYSSRAISDILRGITTIQRLCINYTLEIVKLEMIKIIFLFGSRKSKTHSNDETGIRPATNAAQFRFLGNCPPTPP